MVRATNVLGFPYSLHSNGVTVQLEPLLPGRVRDGDVIGFDLNYQASITQLSANWDDFGKDKKVDSVPNGNGTINDLLSKMLIYSKNQRFLHHYACVDEFVFHFSILVSFVYCKIRYLYNRIRVYTILHFILVLYHYLLFGYQLISL